MSTLLRPNGTPVNPAAYFQLVPDETLDEIYNAFNSDAPMRFEIEWDGMRHNLLVYGWVLQKTDAGCDFNEVRKATVRLNIPKGYVCIGDLSDERTIQ